MTRKPGSTQKPPAPPGQGGSAPGQAEADRLRTVLEATSEAVWELNPLTGAVYYSPSWARMLGYGAEEIEPGIQTWERLLHPDDRAAATAGVEAHLRDKTDRYEVEFRLKNKAGEWQWVVSRGKVIERDTQGRATRVIGTLTDLSARKRAAETLTEVAEQARALEEFREQLRRSERLASIGTLAAGVAHEINNPLGTIMIAAQMALQRRGGPEAAEVMERSLQSIIDNARRCGEIVRSIRQFARREAAEKSPLGLNKLVRESVRLTSQYARERKAVVELDLNQHLPKVLGNAVQLQQVIVHLILNAVESGPAVQVCLSTRKAPTGVELIVRDNGRGVSGEEVKHLFDPFYTTRQHEGGIGLGLSIAHGIIAEHSGSIAVNGQPGQGTMFTITLPVARGTAGSFCGGDI